MRALCSSFSAPYVAASVMTVALRRCVTPDYSSDHNTLHLFQATAPTVSTIDASLVFAGPLLDHLLRVVL